MQRLFVEQLIHHHAFNICSPRGKTLKLYLGDNTLYTLANLLVTKSTSPQKAVGPLSGMFRYIPQDKMKTNIYVNFDPERRKTKTLLVDDGTFEALKEKESSDQPKYRG